MRSYISGSDRKFLAIFFISASVLGCSFYYMAEKFSETMLMEKENLRVLSLKTEAELSEFALIGTSHADSHSMPSSVPYVRFTGGHNLPPAMYYEAKALLKYPTKIKVVYIEADDHIFMNGPSYEVKDTSDEGFEENSMYITWHDYFDTEGKTLFSKKPAGDELASISLQPDIKPVLLKRLAQRITQGFLYVTPESNAGKETDICKNPIDIVEPDTTNETYWSRIKGEKRDLELQRRLGGFSLDTASPISPLMKKYYEKTIHAFLDRGIQVVLVRFPMSQDFQSRVHPENTLAIQKYLHHLRQENNLPLLDMSHLSKYGDRFFENEDHVHKDFFPLIGSMIIDDFCRNRSKKPT